jgi:hypothetical protein
VIRTVEDLEAARPEFRRRRREAGLPEVVPLSDEACRVIAEVLMSGDDEDAERERDATREGSVPVSQSTEHDTQTDTEGRRGARD